MIFTTAMLRNKYKDYANPLDKIKREIRNKTFSRINRGIYEDAKEVNPYMLAGIILSPSYYKRRRKNNYNLEKKK